MPRGRKKMPNTGIRKTKEKIEIFFPIVVQYCIYVAQHKPEYRRKENIEYADSQVDRYNELYFITWHHTSTTDAWLCCGMAIPHTQQYKVVPPSKFTW